MGNVPYQPHGVVKNTVIQEAAELGASLIEAELTLPRLFLRETVEQFRGKEGDQLTFRAPGRLPYRKRQFRDPRNNPIVFDVYKESVTHVTWGGILESNVEVSDEQNDFDLRNLEPVITAQANAVSQGVKDSMADAVTGAPYEVTIGKAEQDLRGALVEARKVLNKFRGVGSRILVVGSDFEAAMLNDEKIVFANASGDAIAEDALAEATLGRLAGFTVILDNTIDPSTAYATLSTAFVQFIGAPAVPRGVPFGASFALPVGVAARYMHAYSMEYKKDMASLDLYASSAPILDRVLPKSAFTDSPTAFSFDPSAVKQHFVRGVKLHLTEESVYPGKSDPEKAGLVAETGVSDATAWKPRTK